MIIIATENKDWRDITLNDLMEATVVNTKMNDTIAYKTAMALQYVFEVLEKKEEEKENFE